ncbi:RPM1-interacting protein 4 isoform X1 [Helianthus annuus]|uniref:RPM1-interacting protein 4 isoform X1 n=1 Tax=Helianthus annuus TaxID=4232 RepID=UPI000B8EF3F1|nr:RPM1-interacting protein 4 isoform X1 [Helianthus annuus]
MTGSTGHPVILSFITSTLAQRSQVPKFGDWENQDDVPYTVYFEKAKKGRKSKMTPQISDPSLNNNQSFQAPEEAHISYDESIQSEPEKPKVQDSSRTKHETRVSREEVDLRKSSDSSSQPRRVSRPSAGSVQSFDNSPMHPRHHARGGNKASVSSESSYGAGSSTPGRRLGPVTRGDENVDDGPAIPKFGDWDDNDPASAEGYTEVFNKARHDKHAGGGKSPMITSENTNYFGQRKEKPKVFGCFPWGRK